MNIISTLTDADWLLAGPPPVLPTDADGGALQLVARHAPYAAGHVHCSTRGGFNTVFFFN